MMQQTPPGWYLDPSGNPGQRYWDGQQWGPVAPPTQPVAQPPSHKVRNTLLIVAGLLVAIVLIAIAGGTDTGNEKTASKSSPTSTAPEPSTPSAMPAPAVTPNPTTHDGGQQITYEVHSDAPLLSVSYFDELNNMTQVANQPADWTTSFTGKATYQMHSMSAQTSGEQVSCQITIDGTVVASQTASGRYAVVTCSAA